jgi:cellulose synthase/poly-beta-1,6-N-acetylglucosamine synthase-like glycosyltransferase
LIKRDLFTEIDTQSADDFERTLIVLKHGYNVAYEPKARVSEEETEKASQEISRKVRIITQEWFALSRNLILLNPFKFPAISYLLISHKLIRWLFFVFILTGFVSSLFLLSKAFYMITCALQVVVYGLGIVGLKAQKHNVRIPFTGIPAYLVAMIYSSAVAFSNFVFNIQSFGLWKPIR